MHRDLLIDPCESDDTSTDATCSTDVHVPCSKTSIPNVGFTSCKIKEEPTECDSIATNKSHKSEFDSSVVNIKIEPTDTVLAQQQLDHSSNINTPLPMNLKSLSKLETYSQLYEYFGDSLAARLPYIQLNDFYIEAKPELVRLFNIPELMQTDEELLEAFNVKEEEVQSNSMEDDRYSYEDHDDNSLMSDDGEGDVEPETTDVDLRIKSTVSDPIQGIKLTITKLPRAPPPPAPVHGESGKVITKLSIKIPKEQLIQPEPEPPPVKQNEEEVEETPFESVTLKPRCMYIDLNFEGSTPTPSHKLKRKHPGGHPFYRLVFGTEVYRIGLKMKTSGRYRSCTTQETHRKRLTRAFRSGNLLTIL